MSLANLGDYFVAAWQRIRYSRKWWPYAGAVILGLGLARLTNAAVLYQISRNAPISTQKGNFVAGETQNSAFIDPSVTIGGPLFANPGQDQANAASAALEVPAKPFKLIGTLEGDPSFARALIEIQGESSKEYCQAGNACRKKECECRINDSVVVSILHEYIWVKQGATRFKLKIGQTTTEALEKNAASPQPPAQTVKTAETAVGGVIKKVISREEVNKNILGNPASIYQGAAFGPYMQNGKIEGYRIAKVAEDHVFYKLGARNGDIIRKVNGYALNDTERMFELWKTIKTAPAVKIELERDGKTVTYDFQIRN